MRRPRLEFRLIDLDPLWAAESHSYALSMELMERYQIILEKDPRSQVFAPLAEAYRKMGLIEEAFRICVRGVQYHPGFSGGRIALAKVLLDRDNVPGAAKELEKAIEVSPDNILAHQLLGEIYLAQKDAKLALRSWKMVMFLAPTNERALSAVKKLESLTADEYEEEIFSMKPLKQATHFEGQLEQLTPLGQPQAGSSRIAELDRFMSLTDAYLVRNDFDRAMETLREAQKFYSNAPELIKRMRLLQSRTGLDLNDEPMPEKPMPREAARIEQKITLLQSLRGRFQARVGT
jgi:tetratricopeptide (TPR) repeat protein